MKCKVGDLAWYIGTHEPAKGWLFKVLSWDGIIKAWELSSIFGPVRGIDGKVRLLCSKRTRLPR